MSAAPPDWSGRRVLVLGATGFLGGWTAEALARAGARLHAAARDPAAAESALARRGLRADVVRADLAAPGAAARIVADLRPDAVFDLAGYGVRAAERDERLAQRMNAEVPEEIATALAAQRTASGGDPVLVLTGSGVEYGDAGGDLREDGPARPVSVYGRTKLAGTRAVLRVCASSGLRAFVARPFTVYGPGEPPGRLLPTLIEAARSGRGADLTAGDQERDFVYVEDVAEALVRLGAATAPRAAVVNVATGMLVAVRDFALEAAAVFGIDRPLLRFGATANTREEMRHDPVDTSRLAAITGWRPARDVASGLRRTRELLSGAAGSRR